MAEFTKGVQPVEADYLGMSRGTSDAPSPGKVFENLFEGVGNTLKVYAQETNDAQQSAIQKNVWNAYDNANGAIGVDAIEADPNNDQLFTTNTPTAVNTTIASIKRLSQARDAGKVSDLAYWSRMEAEVKKIRSKYPGQREFIDKEVSRITGGTPANQIRNELVSNMEKDAASRKTQRSQEDSFINSNIGLISPDLIAAHEQGVPGSFHQIRAQVGSRKSVSENLQSRKAQLEADAAQGKVDEEGYNQLAMDTTNAVATTFFQDTAASGGYKGFNDLQTKIVTSLNSGKNPTPEEQAQIRAQWATLKAGYQQSLQTSLTTADESGHSIATRMDPSRLKGVLDFQMSKISAMEDMITNQNWGLLNVTMNNQKAASDSRVADLLKKNPVWQNIQDIRKIGGDNLVSEMWGNSPALNEAMTAIVNSHAVGAIANGDKTLGARLDENRAAGVKEGNVAQAEINTNVNVLQSKSADPVAKLNVAKSMFGDNGSDFMKNFRTSTDKVGVMSRMASPEVTKTMLGLKEQNPDVWNNYSQWVRGSFVATFKDIIDTTAQGNEQDAYTQVKWDPKSMQYTWSVTPAGREAHANPVGLLGSGQSWSNMALDDSVRKMNQAISLLKPVMTADGMDDAAIGDQLTRLIASKPQQGTDPNSLIGKISRSMDIMDKNVKDTISGRSPSGGDPFAPFWNSWTASETRDPLSEGKLLNFIAAPESRDNYNSMFWNKDNKLNLDQFTVGEVQELQRRAVAAGAKSSAMGRYQIIRTTLNDLVQDGKVDPKARFTPQLQDQIAMTLLEKRGLSQYRAGSMTKEAFAHELSKEWAALPSPKTGKSFYDGDGLNAAGVSVDALYKAMDEESQLPAGATPNEGTASPEIMSKFGEGGDDDAQKTLLKRVDNIDKETPYWEMFNFHQPAGKPYVEQAKKLTKQIINNIADDPRVEEAYAKWYGEGTVDPWAIWIGVLHRISAFSKDVKLPQNERDWLDNTDTPDGAEDRKRIPIEQLLK